jgi:catechol 2,3-dioxygenase-like lactoylglutathione lyase family enzyme
MTQLRLRLHHFGLSVADLDTTIAWYIEKLGFERDYAYQIPPLQARVAFLRLGDLRVELFEVRGAAPAPSSASTPASDLGVHGLKHVALAVEDIEVARDHLQARGVEFVTDVAVVPASNTERYAFFRDNNGILIELFEPHGP